jgi:hypothetical protein
MAAEAGPSICAPSGSPGLHRKLAAGVSAQGSYQRGQLAHPARIDLLHLDLVVAVLDAGCQILLVHPLELSAIELDTQAGAGGYQQRSILETQLPAADDLLGLPGGNAGKGEILAPRRPGA